MRVVLPVSGSTNSSNSPPISVATFPICSTDRPRYLDSDMLDMAHTLIYSRQLASCERTCHFWLLAGPVAKGRTFSLSE